MSTTGIWVLGDQLSLQQAALVGEKRPVILIESRDYVKERRYHKQKLVLIWSAMRHFAEELRQQGFEVTYAYASDFQTPLKEWIDKNGITRLRVMTPSDRPFAKLIEKLDIGCEIELVENNQFLWSVTEFKQWANNRKRLLLEDFYREGA